MSRLVQIRSDPWQSCTYIVASEWFTLAEALHHNPFALAFADEEDENVSLELDWEDDEILRLIWIKVKIVSSVG